MKMQGPYLKIVKSFKMATAQRSSKYMAGRLQATCPHSRLWKHPTVPPGCVQLPVCSWWSLAGRHFENFLPTIHIYVILSENIFSLFTFFYPELVILKIIQNHNIDQLHYSQYYVYLYPCMDRPHSCYNWLYVLIACVCPEAVKKKWSRNMWEMSFYITHLTAHRKSMLMFI